MLILKLLCVSTDPLFVRQHLISLLDKELIYFEDGELVWDNSLIEKSNSVSCSLDSITCDKLKQLPELAQLGLQVCACIGSKISFETLGHLLREICDDNDIMNDHETEATSTSFGMAVISPVIEEGLLVTSQDGSSVSFVHDSVQSAAYSLLDSVDQAQFHWKLGQILKSELPNPDTWSLDHLFAVAKQFSCGWKCVQEFERFEVVDILTRAAEESKMVADFRGAHYFYEVVLENLLHHSDWARHYTLCSKTHLMGAENALWANKLHYTDRWLNILDIHIKGSTIYELKALPVRLNWIATRRIEDAIYFGLKKLRSLLGIKIITRNMKLRYVVRPGSGLRIFFDNKSVSISILPHLSILDRNYQSKEVNEGTHRIDNSRSSSVDKRKNGYSPAHTQSHFFSLRWHDTYTIPTDMLENCRAQYETWDLIHYATCDGMVCCYN